MKRAELTPVLGGGALLLAVAGVAFGFSSYWLFLATSAVLGALIALSVGVVHGRAGMVTLCPMAFAGIGAWTTGWLGMHTGLPFVVLVLVGGLAAVPVGVLIGLPALRLRGVNLAVATLAFGGAVAVMVFDKGFPGAAARTPVARPSFASSESGFFLLCVLVLVLVAVALSAASRRSTGARWTAVRDSERATAALGYSVTTTKLTAFATSAFIAGLGGALMAGQLGILSGVGFQPMASIVVFTAAVAFGSSYVEGALLAGVATTVVPELLRQLGLPQDVAPGLFALAALQALAAGSEGVAGQLRAALRARHRKRRTMYAAETAPEPAGEPVPRPRPPIPEEPVLRATGVSVRYGTVTALDSVDLTIRAGSVHGLIGPNGAGKSTLIDVLSGFVAPTSGRLLLRETPMDGVPPHLRARQGIRRSFQQGRVNPQLTIGQYLTLSGRGLADRSLVERLIRAFGCPPAGTRVADVDVGTRRLVEVAATLAAQPTVVLLDEPAAGLSAEESAGLGRAIAGIPEHFGCSVLLVEHDIELVASCCDEATALDFGRVIANGTPADVLGDPAVARAYLGADGGSEPRRTIMEVHS
ncbi:branched-chain amino acid ABC transporter ATP-binding protein/permease [Streptomyces sp. PSKA54]|uniref:Branched-chain amino acid ABC transporter ATP-binding protein/permease n=1 Tax=Streptomyces himalayensis subsp. aureolus TaxID=2758039 RepID=A0A7W2D8H1_9ACTN|nr:ATP-binding cassette domain-containing protein [Streptomyces himalayensis]MBA4866604.1 branched-chain amino acid ABC transporter ATP-binding protein/permease [Streptomyces himalayensis subsp. aureolus]